MKINFDGSWHRENNKDVMVLAVVVKGEGNYITFSKKIIGGSAFEAEVRAFELALTLAKKLELSSVNFFTDLACIPNILKEVLNGRKRVCKNLVVNKIFHDIVELLPENYTIEWIPRRENKEADYLTYPSRRKRSKENNDTLRALQTLV